MTYLHERCASFQVYSRYYWSGLLAGLIVIVGFVGTIIWFLAVWVYPEKADGPTFSEVRGPFVTLLAYFFAYLTGTYLSERLLGLRRNYPAMPLEQDEDQTSRPWRYINHSFPKTRWHRDFGLDELSTIREVYRDTEPFWARGVFKVFERLLEETATDNYRVFSILGPPRLIRIHKDINFIDLECRDRVLAHLKKMSVFRNEFLQCLEPLEIQDRSGKANNDSLSVPDSLSRHLRFVPDRDVYIQMFPYLDIDSHYTGKHVNQLASVAQKFGFLQTSLAKLDNDDRKFLVCRSKKNTLVDAGQSSERIKAHWKSILRAAERLGTENQYSKTLEDEGEFGSDHKLTNWVEEAAILRDSPETKHLLLHDIHPHNVFCKGNECVLIYDYTWIGEWRHSWVVAFSLHRFVREFVIRNAKKEIEGCEDECEHPEKVKQLCRQGKDLFLRSYRAHCSLPLPEDFETNLGAYIRCSNIDKMLGAFEKGLGIKGDIRNRPAERLLGEARKFVRFMRESEAF